MLRHHLTRAATLVGAFALTMLPAAAHADTVTKSDPVGDATPPTDITRVTYRNGAHATGARIRIPKLQRQGFVLVMIAKPRSDVGYAAVLQIHSDGSLTKRLMHSTAADWRRVNCRLTARWDTRHGLVSVSVPQTCLNALRGSPNYMMYVRAGDHGDLAPPVRVRRG